MSRFFVHKSNREVPRIATGSFIVSNAYSFRLIERKRMGTPTPAFVTQAPTEHEETLYEEREQTPPTRAVHSSANQPAPDDRRRLFMRLAGVAGLGVVAATVLPKRAEAFVMGSTPTSNVVGVKNASNVRISPATETTLAGVKTKTDSLTFDGSSNLQVGGDVGLQNASNVTINPATEDTLALIQAQTNKLTFDGSNNLMTTGGGGGAASTVALKDTTSTTINPATDDSIVYLRRMVKLMESQAAVDSANRQRITLDSLGTGTAITTTVPVSGTVTATVSLSAGANAIGSITAIDGQGHQMFQDFGRTAYATGIRQFLIFS